MVYQLRDTAEVVRVTTNAYDRTTTNQPSGQPVTSTPSDLDELVTVVVPARNEEVYLRACLRSICEQTWSNLQIVVVDGASRDHTADVVRRIQSTDPRVELLHNPNSVIPVSMNLALAAARGRWLIRVDAHSTIPPYYVATAVTLLRSGDWGGVGGRKDGVGQTAAGRAIAAAMGSRFGVGNSTYHYGDRQQAVEHIPFGCYPVELLHTVGGWDESLRVNEDFELDYRLRMLDKTLLFDPALVIRWHSQQRVPDLFRQYRRYGAGKFEVALKHPRSLRARHLAAPALITALAVATVAAPRRSWLAASIVAPYVAALGVATMTTARKLPDPESRRWVAPAFAAMHVGWGIGFWSAAAIELRGRSVRILGRRPRGSRSGQRVATAVTEAQRFAAVRFHWLCPFLDRLRDRLHGGGLLVRHAYADPPQRRREPVRQRESRCGPGGAAEVEPDETQDDQQRRGHRVDLEADPCAIEHPQNHGRTGRQDDRAGPEDRGRQHLPGQRPGVAEELATDAVRQGQQHGAPAQADEAQDTGGQVGGARPVARSQVGSAGEFRDQEDERAARHEVERSEQHLRGTQRADVTH